MQVEELYDLTNWVISRIAEEQIVQKYQQLHAVLQQNAQANQQKQPFEDQKEALIQAIGSVPLDQLSKGQIDALGQLGIAQNVGSEGVALIEDVLFKNAIDIANAAQRINKCIVDLSQGIQWSQQEKELLNRIITSDSVATIEDKVLLRVHFAGDARVENLTELRDWSKTWWDIGRGISMAYDQSPEAIAVVGASKGSIIVSLVTAYGIAKTVSGIIFASLKVVEKYYEIKRKAQEVRALEIGNDKAEKELEKAAQAHKDAGVESIVKQTIKELGLDARNEGDKVNELTSATKKLVDFIVKGGEVDFVVPDDEEGEPDSESKDAEVRSDLRVRFQEVRKLEREVKQLEHERP